MGRSWRRSWRITSIGIGIREGEEDDEGLNREKKQNTRHGGNLMYAMTKPSINFLSPPLTPESGDNEIAQRKRRDGRTRMTNPLFPNGQMAGKAGGNGQQMAANRQWQWQWQQMFLPSLTNSRVVSTVATP